MTRVFLAGLRFQALVLWRSPAEIMVLLTAPFFTLMFAAIVVHAGRADLAPYAVLGPTVIAIWGMALNVSGDIIDSERYNATFELALATPAPMAVLILGRITTVTIASLLSLVESAVIVRLAFGITVTVAHPVLFACTLVLTVGATAGTASAFSALFVLARSARTFQNSLSYPLYLLSGAMVPAALLPGWLQPATKLVFLSWSANLMRGALTPLPVKNAVSSLAALATLGVLGYLAGLWLMAAVLRRTRTRGTAGFA